MVNLITNIPDDIKLELSNGTLTLKSGSIITLPNGTQLKTTSDSSPNNYGAAGVSNYVFVTSAGTVYSLFSSTVVNVVGSGSSLPADDSTYKCFYNTTDNKIYMWTAGAWVYTPLSLPIAIVTKDSSGKVVSIDQVFNGFGYIGNALYVLPNVKGLILEGRDTDGNPKYKEITNKSLIIRDGYSGQYASLISKDDSYTSINFFNQLNYNNTANIFIGNPNETPFYYNNLSLNLSIEPRELDSTIIGLSQYANSLRFEPLRKELVDIFNQVSTIQNFYDFIFNLKTATGYGLDFWGGILNKDRYLTYFNTNNNQNEIVFLKGAQTIDGVDYSDDDIENLYRLILYLRAMSYISNASISKLNEMLQFYFQNRGLAYVYEYGTMKIRYVFRFYINKLEKAIFESDIMPNPTGVLVDFEYLPKGAYFGFFVAGKSATDQPYAPFNQKPFYG